MPKFTNQADGRKFWLPPGQVLFMEESEGRLTTKVVGAVMTPKGAQITAFEVEGRIDQHADALDNPLRGIAAAPVAGASVQIGDSK